MPKVFSRNFSFRGFYLSALVLARSELSSPVGSVWRCRAALEWGAHLAWRRRMVGWVPWPLVWETPVSCPSYPKGGESGFEEVLGIESQQVAWDGGSLLSSPSPMGLLLNIKELIQPRAAVSSPLEHSCPWRGQRVDECGCELCRHQLWSQPLLLSSQQASSHVCFLGKQLHFLDVLRWAPSLHRARREARRLSLFLSFF